MGGAAIHVTGRRLSLLERPSDDVLKGIERPPLRIIRAMNDDRALTIPFDHRPLHIEDRSRNLKMEASLVIRLKFEDRKKIFAVAARDGVRAGAISISLNGPTDLSGDIPLYVVKGVD